MAIIAVSRQVGSGGEELARLLAGRLGYRFVSRAELTETIAAASGIRREPPAAEAEGRSPSRLEQVWEQLSGDRDVYRSALRTVVTELAAADDVVLVGHGAGQFLVHLRSAIRVLVIAPVQARVERLVAAGAGRDEAARRVREQDRDSGSYLRYLFEIDWLDPHGWDFVVNTGRVSIPAAVETLGGYVAALARDDAERARLASMQLASRVEAALLGDPELGVDRLRVEADARGVVLEGEALTEEDRAAVEKLARSIAQGSNVDNRIVVHPPATP